MLLAMLSLVAAQITATVIRIDPVGGNSDYRRWPVAGGGSGPADAESYYWTSLNKGKRSVAIDMRSEEGRELVTALITAPGEDRGVLVDNVVGRRWMSNAAFASGSSVPISFTWNGSKRGSPDTPAIRRTSP